MLRRACIVVPGIPWHIIQRGNNRSACFYAEEDFVYYLHFLRNKPWSVPSTLKEFVGYLDSFRPRLSRSRSCFHEPPEMYRVLLAGPCIA